MHGLDITLSFWQISPLHSLRAEPVQDGRQAARHSAAGLLGQRRRRQADLGARGSWCRLRGVQVWRGEAVKLIVH